MSAKVYRAALTVEELMGRLKRLLLMQHKADRLICRYLADVADGMTEWSILVMGYGGVVEMVRARLGLTRKSIRERIRIGRALRTLPALDAALTSGRLTYSRVREVTRVATPADEWLWLEAAQALSMRALELRVSLASGRPRSRPRRTGPQRSDPMQSRDNGGEVRLSLPADVWALVEQAVHVVRAAFGENLTDAQALAAVARSALAHHNASVRQPLATPLGVQVTDQTCAKRDPSWDGEPVRPGRTQRGDEENGLAGAARETPHSGPGEGGLAGAARETPRSGPRERSATEGDWTGDAAGRERVSGGSSEAKRGDGKASERAVERVSPDERRLLEVLASGRSLTLGTLCDTSRLSPSRTACALYELIHAGRVTRDSIGLCDVFRLQRVGAEFTRAG